MAGGVDAAERGAAVAVPQALRRRRRRVRARAVRAALAERAIGRRRARRVALPGDAHAALAARGVAVASHDAARAAAVAAVVVAAAIGAGLARRAGIGARIARGDAMAEAAHEATGAIAVDLARR